MLQATSGKTAPGPLTGQQGYRMAATGREHSARGVEPGPVNQPPTAESPRGRALAKSTVLQFQLWNPEGDPPGPHQQAAPGQPESTRWIARHATDASELEFPEVGAMVGGFVLIKELGRGASSRVFLARDTSLNNRVIVLKVGPQVGSEAEALALLSHPNIMPVYSVWDDPQTRLRFLCMPFVPARTLATLLESRGRRDRSAAEGILQADRGPGRPVGPGRHSGESALARACRAWAGRFPPVMAAPKRWQAHAADGQLRGIHIPPSRFPPLPVPEAIEIGIQLADALAHAHARGVLHRDLKPSNVLVSGDGQAYLIDFHLATFREVEPRPGPFGGPSILGGTLSYMAPEHIEAFNPVGQRSPSDVDERSDLYGLGLVVYEMLAGRPAFVEPSLGMPTTQRLTRMAESRRAAPIPDPCEHNRAVPARLSAVLRHCLAPEPTDRYAGAGEFAEDLRRVRDHLPLRHTHDPSRVGSGLAACRRIGGRMGLRCGLLAGFGLGWAIGTVSDDALSMLWR